MKRKWWLVPVVLALVAVLWMFARGTVDTTPIQTALGVKPAPIPAEKSKPVCSQIIVPAGDCIPQHIANLPPDPGPAGMLTIEGIDADKDGIRDDVQRFIAENWGDSPLAVKVLTMIAENKLTAVKLGGELGREETQKLAPKVINAARCYVLATPDLAGGNAMELVSIRVTNTVERFKRAHAFEYQMAHQVYIFKDESITELCGFDPATIQ
jgi:hypothetical protein